MPSEISRNYIYHEHTFLYPILNSKLFKEIVMVMGVIIQTVQRNCYGKEIVMVGQFAPSQI